MAQQFIHSDFMSALTSGFAHAAVNSTGQGRDILDGILLYVAFDEAVSLPLLSRAFSKKRFSHLLRTRKCPGSLAQVTQPLNYVTGRSSGVCGSWWM